MNNSIFNILMHYGFSLNADNSISYGIGSLVWGHTVKVEHLGNNLYKIYCHTWSYNCEGDCEKDEKVETVLYGALLLEYVFEKLPLR